MDPKQRAYIRSLKHRNFSVATIMEVTGLPREEVVAAMRSKRPPRRRKSRATKVSSAPRAQKRAPSRRPAAKPRPRVKPKPTAPPKAKREPKPVERPKGYGASLRNSPLALRIEESMRKRLEEG